MPHIHELIDYSVDVFIVEGDAVLLRKHDKYKMWLTPGGHIELDETPQDAAIREVKEEVGMDVVLVGDVPAISEGEAYNELLAPRYMNIHPISDTHKHIGMVYFAKAATRDYTQGENEVSDGLKWFTKEELADPQYGISETIKYYANAALDTVS